MTTFAVEPPGPPFFRLQVALSDKHPRLSFPLTRDQVVALRDELSRVLRSAPGTVGEDADGSRGRKPKPRSTRGASGRTYTAPPAKPGAETTKIGGRAAPGWITLERLEQAVTAFFAGESTIEFSRRTGLNRGIVSPVVSEVVRLLGGERKRGFHSVDPTMKEKWERTANEDRAALCQKALGFKSKEEAGT